MLAFFSCLIAGAGAVALVTAGILLWKVWKTDQGVQMAESDASVEMTGTSDAESTCAQAAEAGTEESLGQVQLSDDSPLKKIVTSGKAVSENRLLSSLTGLSREASLHKIFKKHPLKLYPYLTVLRNKRHGEIQRVFCSLQKHISQII